MAQVSLTKSENSEKQRLSFVERLFCAHRGRKQISLEAFISTLSTPQNYYMLVPSSCTDSGALCHEDRGASVVDGGLHKDLWAG